MSRIGNQKIHIPDGVEVKLDASTITVKGPKGELSYNIHPLVTVNISDADITASVKKPNDKKQRALWGTTASNIANLIEGVTTGFSRALEVNGVGYKVESKGKNLVLHLGYSHPIDYALPEGVAASVEGNVITIEGIDKQLVGSVAAKIRSFRKPEPYKGKGVKYVEEHIRRKAGKVVKAAE